MINRVLYSLTIILGLFLLTNCIKKPTKYCQMPAQYIQYYKHEQQIPLINNHLTCGANVLLYAIPKIFQDTAFKNIGRSFVDLKRISYEQMATLLSGKVTGINVTEDKIISRDGHNIPIRIYQDTNYKKSFPVLLYFHGGGWSSGSLNTHDILCKKLAKELNYKVIAVEYRLAPEFPYPVPLNDVEDVYYNLRKNSPIILAGDSAGGNLAAALTIRLIKKHQSLPCNCILIYPALDLRTIAIPKDNPYIVNYLLTSEAVNSYVITYLGKKLAQASNDDEISPIITDEEILQKFPPTIIISAECDPLTPSQVAWIQKAKSCKNNIAHLMIEKTPHAFAQFLDVFPDEINRMILFIKQNL